MHVKLKPLIGCLALAGLGTHAIANDNLSAAEADEAVERIRVTGSSIKRTTLEGELPITVFTRDEINAAGITSGEQLLMQLNIAGNGVDNMASNEGISTADNRANHGNSGANLRGQGSDATLVLLNGRRLAPHGLKGRSVDLNSIPFAALDRVEILRDGASAVYGTDAIGGVINFITRRDYTGAQVSGFADVTEAGAGHIYRANALFGVGDFDQDGWNAFATITAKRNLGIRGTQRDFTNSFQEDRGLSPDTRGTPFATIFNVSTDAAPGLIGSGLIDPNPNSPVARQDAINILALPGGGGCESGGDFMGRFDPNLYPWSPQSQYACAWEYGRHRMLQSPLESLDFVGRLSFNLGDSHEMFFELSAAHVESRKSFEHYQISSSALATAQFNPSTWYPSTGANYDRIYNALGDYFGFDGLNYGAPIAYRWRCIECGPRTFDTDTTSYRALLAFEGMVGDYDYTVGLSRSENTSKTKLVDGYYYLDQLQTLLGSGTLDPFVFPGQQSQAALDGLAAASAAGLKLYEGTTTLTQLDAVVSGDLGFELPGGFIQAAVGTDLRREEYKFDGSDLEPGRTVPLAPFDDQNALDRVSRNIKAVFAEVYLPVLDNLDLTLAGRYDHYSGFGSTTNPKVSLKYQPVEQVMVRAAYSTGFKVPNFNQLFEGERSEPITVDTWFDPASCPDGQVSETPGCESIQPNLIRGGKVDLQPEESTQKSIGVVLVPTDNFNISVDWWEIERTNTIRVATQAVLLENYASFQENFIRDSSGQITAIDARFINSGGTLTRGIEVDANLTGELAGGSWRLRLNGNYLQSFKTKALDTLPYSENLVGQFVYNNNLPIKWKHTLNFSYTHGDFMHSLTQIYRHGYESAVFARIASGVHNPPNFDYRVKSYTTYNYSLTYRGLENTLITMGIKNLFDQDPPFSSHNMDSAAGSAWEPRVADPRGRAYTLLVEYTF
ncbi:TonB-dependent receptor domain-containing protein [Alkalimonas cellulosilytica]|uniref:TonB-dependent receptor domain-containing protein n=1 Tax=Alkalimonas cellulosilytica TaxID=3058395 RepID=UPI0038B41429